MSSIRIRKSTQRRHIRNVFCHRRINRYICIAAGILFTFTSGACVQSFKCVVFSLLRIHKKHIYV